jgi:hypothetical protein
MVLSGVYGDGRVWNASQYLTVDLDLDGSGFGAEEKSLQDLQLHILHDLCVDIVIGVKDIVTYNLFNLLEVHLRASVENAGSKVAMTISETEDLENGVGELQEAFPPVNEVEQTVKTLYDAISSDLSVSQRDDHELLIKEFIHCFSNELDRKINCKIPPMNLVKLEQMWNEAAMKSMKLKARRQCPEHYEEIDRQVEKLMKRGFIEECNAEYYSQVLLARKQDKTDCVQTTDISIS